MILYSLFPYCSAQKPYAHHYGSDVLSRPVIPHTLHGFALAARRAPRSAGDAWGRQFGFGAYGLDRPSAV